MFYTVSYTKGDQSIVCEVHKTQDTNVQGQLSSYVLSYLLVSLTTPFPSSLYTVARDPPHGYTARHYLARLSWGMGRETASLRRASIHFGGERGVNPLSPRCMSM